MEQYRLLKDLPTFRAGQLAYVSSLGNLMAGTPEEPETADTGLNLMIYHRVTLEKFPEILTEWFKEIEEPTDSIHWKPVLGDEYWLVYADGDIGYAVCTGSSWDDTRYKMGRTYRTEKEAEKARDRELVEARLRRTSTFTPDWEDGLQIKYVVIFNHVMNRLEVHELTFEDLGLPVYFESEVSAMKSIRENKQDWKIYFGIKEEK